MLLRILTIIAIVLAAAIATSAAIAVAPAHGTLTHKGKAIGDQIIGDSEHRYTRMAQVR